MKTLSSQSQLIADINLGYWLNTAKYEKQIKIICESFKMAINSLDIFFCPCKNLYLEYMYVAVAFSDNSDISSSN